MAGAHRTAVRSARADRRRLPENAMKASFNKFMAAGALAVVVFGLCVYLVGRQEKAGTAGGASLMVGSHTVGAGHSTNAGQLNPQRVGFARMQEASIPPVYRERLYHPQKPPYTAV